MLAGELVEIFDLEVMDVIQSEISLLEEPNTGKSVSNLSKQK